MFGLGQEADIRRIGDTPRSRQRAVSRAAHERGRSGLRHRARRPSFDCPVLPPRGAHWRVHTLRTTTCYVGKHPGAR
jgi:hypothetical protein